MRLFKTLLGLAVIGTSFALLLVVKLPASNPFWVELQNSGHAPIFGAVAIALLMISKNVIGERIRPLTHYVVAFIAAASTGVVSELMQEYVAHRDATYFDLYIDMLGIVAFLCLALIAEGSRKGWFQGWQKALPVFGVALALGLLGLAFIQPAQWASAYHYRDNNLPELIDFDSNRESKFYYSNRGSVERVPAPAEWASRQGSMVGKLTFKTGGRWPVFKFQHVFPDWRGYEQLAFDFYNPESEPLRLTFRIDDVHHNYTYEDRLNHYITVQPGENFFKVPLKTVLEAPQTRDTDMSALMHIMWFARNDLTRARRLYLDNVRLE